MPNSNNYKTTGEMKTIDQHKSNSACVFSHLKCKRKVKSRSFSCQHYDLPCQIWRHAAIFIHSIKTLVWV